MSKTSASSDTSPNLESGATDSPWQPSWWQWLILALSGTLEIERQIAWLKKSNEEARQRHEQRMSELRKETEELRKSDEEAKRQHDLRMSELRKETEELKRSNEEPRKSDEEAKRQHELRMSELRKETEQLRKENERLAELELKLDAVLPKSVSN
jgi:DNA repair exonuclease SbcCD ATPase subunit